MPPPQLEKRVGRFTIRPIRRLAVFVLVSALLLACAAVALAGPKDPRLHKRPADVKRAKTLIMRLRDLPDGFVS